MYTVDEKGNKKPIRKERFVPPTAMAQRRLAPTRENYGSGKTYPKWLYWVLGALALVLIVMLVKWALKSSDKSASMAQQRFGFRFY